MTIKKSFGYLGTQTFVLWALSCPVWAASEAPCKSTLVGDLRIEKLQSKTYSEEITIRVWLPAGYNEAANAQSKYPTLYMFDGQTLFDECTAFHGEHELKVDETLTRLIAEHRVPPMIVVGIDSTIHRSHEYRPFPDIIGDPKAPPPIGRQLSSFLAEDVIPFVTGRYRITSDSAHTGIGGTSLGGAAALYVAVNRPDLFRLALLESPTLILGNGQILRDTMHLARTPDRVAIGFGSTELHFSGIEGYLAPVGLTEQDADAGGVDMANALASNLERAYLKRSAVCLTIQPGANHSSESWAFRIPDALVFLYSDAPKCERTRSGP